MNTRFGSELPPVDFVTFLAQRGGLSQEAAERRLERWLGEYQTLSGQQPSRATRVEVGQSIGG